MHILLSLLISSIVYINTFKSDFSEENLSKLYPAVGVLAVLTILGFVMTLMKS